MPDFVLESIDPPGIPGRAISPRLRGQLVYFARSRGDAAAAGDVFEFDPDEVACWLDDGVIALVSPLDSANQTEIELSEEQESLLEWVRHHGVRRAAVRPR